MIGNILRKRYKILKPLGQGGFGDTYLAQDLDLPGKPTCVVKHLKPKDSDPNVLQVAKNLFEREAQQLYVLGKKCSQIPQLSAYFEEAGEFYLVQDYIDGHELSQEILPGRRLSENQVMQLLQEILEVLAVVHEHNVIHRDIKPTNLMRRRDGKIILIDFGAVKEIATMLTRIGGQSSLTVGIGTPGYMPSEQAHGKPKFASDIYAVGMLGIQSLTGIEPTRLSEDPQTGEIVWRSQAQVSHRLGDILDRMVRYDFRQRYSNATEALTALRPSSVPPVPLPNPTPPAAPSAPLPNSTPPAAPSLSITKFTTVTVNSKGAIIERRPGQARMFVQALGKGVTLEMVSIPGGKFLMGSPKTEAGRYDNESPQHPVTVPAFFMGKYPITQAQYKAVMGKNPSRFQGANRPVEQVSWNEAIEFCQKLSKLTQKTYRLPSEAEWEYACRAGTTTPFHFGETITSELVNYNGNYSYGNAPEGEYRQQTTEVGFFQVANAFGLYDMHGNVWEWCQDIWHDNYQGAPTNGSAWEKGGNASSRLLRGGSWVLNANNCRSALRNRNGPEFRDNYFGFRVVRG